MSVFTFDPFATLKTQGQEGVPAKAANAANPPPPPPPFSSISSFSRGTPTPRTFEAEDWSGIDAWLRPALPTTDPDGWEPITLVSRLPAGGGARPGEAAGTALTWGIIEALLADAGDVSVYIDRRAQVRPVSWANASDEPRRGDRCPNRHARFWREAVHPLGWRCCWCHPPDHLPRAERVEVAT